ncbi:MAG: hypothetical protein V1719_02125 [Patescibacteria group bacterium]
MGLSAEEIINAQILVEVTNEAGVLKIVLPGGQVIIWPSALSKITSGPHYLNLSNQPQSPSKTELAKLVLQEILQLE